MTDAPQRIWAWVDELAGVVGSTERPETPEGMPPGPNATTLCAEYIRADLVPGWSSDMDAAPKDDTRVLTFHPANPKSIVAPARRDDIVVWNARKAGQWRHLVLGQPPTHWMRVDPPKEGE